MNNANLLESDDTVVTTDELESSVVTTADAPPSPPVTPLVPDGIEPLSIKVEPRFGYRNVRGKPTKVPTQHLNILVDGKMHAWTFKQPGQPIFAIAEFLDHEIPQLVAAVKSFTNESQDRPFKGNNTPTQQQIDDLTR